MILERSTDPDLLSNAYLLGDQEGGTAVLIDSGAPLHPILRRLREQRLRLAAVLNTHRHDDHVSGNRAVTRTTGAEVHALREESEHITDARPLEDGELRRFGGLEIRVVALPGHTSGHCGFLVDGVGLFTGDCLFRGSLGGTVGSAATGFPATRRAVEKILALPDDTAVHPGHSVSTSVGRERRENPFLRVMRGHDPEGARRCEALGKPARLIVLARDYDGGTKAWVRFEDGGDAIVPGSRIDCAGFTRDLHSP